MDSKEYAVRTVYAVAVFYGVTYALRRGTRYQAKGLEWVLVAILLFGAAILLPLFLAAAR